MLYYRTMHMYAKRNNNKIINKYHSYYHSILIADAWKNNKKLMKNNMNSLEK